jgi:hypothetical protein
MAILAPEAPIVLSMMLVVTPPPTCHLGEGEGSDDLQYTDKKDGDDAQSLPDSHVQPPDLRNWQRPDETIHNEIGYSICLEEL